MAIVLSEATFVLAVLRRPAGYLISTEGVYLELRRIGMPIDLVTVQNVLHGLCQEGFARAYIRKSDNVSMWGPP